MITAWLSFGCNHFMITMIWVPTRWGIPELRQGQLSFDGRKGAIHDEVKAGCLGPSMFRKVRPEATVRFPFQPA